MEREIQSLRDKQTHQLAKLANVQGTQRELADELDRERDLRQKAEREHEEAINELCGARRSAKFALEQCRREVENRRHAEERAVGLQGELEALQIELRRKLQDAEERERRWRDCFARLGSMFTQAAYDELRGPMIPVASGSGDTVALEPEGPPLKRRRNESH